MNLKIANRLLAYRRAYGLSQEELAEKLGVSRQAVSKWERAEAAPDTDNLIALANLYGVLIDELINGEGEPQVKTEKKEEETEKSEEFEEYEEFDPAEESKSKTINLDDIGINIEDDEDKVHIGLNGIHIVEKNGGDEVHIDHRGIHIKEGENDSVEININKKNRRGLNIISAITPILCTIAYLIIGFTLPRGWACGWLLFFLVPIVPSLVEAIKSKRPSEFEYPVLVTGLYLLAGICFGRWHPEWVIFLTVPVYYMIFK